MRFEHRPLTDGEKKQFPGNGNHQQDRINKAAAERILNSASLDQDWRVRLSAPAPTEANGERMVLDKHLERYTAKNSFDYFIHKDLAGFLRRELDFYLKSQVLNLDDLAAGTRPVSAVPSPVCARSATWRTRSSTSSPSSKTSRSGSGSRRSSCWRLNGA